jgi:hypothetical protein
MKTLNLQCIRDCYDTSTSTYYHAGMTYALEEGDMMAETKYFIDPAAVKALPVEDKEVRLDPDLNRKTLKYLVKKHPAEAKQVDLRKKGAHRALVVLIMKKQGTIEDEDEGKTQAEHLVDEKALKLKAAQKR